MKTLVFYIAILLSISGFSQEQIDTNMPLVNNDKFILPFDSVLELDAYYNLTDYKTDTFGIISMGNQGDVRRSLFFDHRVSFLPTLGMNGYFKNQIAATDLLFYTTKVPLGGIRLQNGYNNGQMFGLYFTISPSASSSVFIDYQRINSEGNYLNQSNKSDLLNFSTTFDGLKGKYVNQTELSWAKYQNGEFGGVLDLGAFAADSVVSRELLDVALTQSSSKAMHFDLTIGQNFSIIKIDTSTSLNLFYDFQIQNSYKTFSSSDSIYLLRSVSDFSLIRDSLRLMNLNSFGGLNFVLGNNHLLKAGVLHTYYRYGNSSQLMAENLLGIKGILDGAFKHFDYDASAKIWLTGSYVGTYELFGSIGVPNLTKKLKLKIFLENGLYRPGNFYIRYLGNTSFWDNALRNISQTKVGGSISSKFWQLGVTGILVDNYVYLDDKIAPAQVDGALAIMNIDVSARFKVIGNFYLDNRIRYQGNTNQEVIRIPDLILRHTLYYKKELFNRSLKTQTGVEFQYFSSFKSEGYDPATSVMYLQDVQEIGGFPYFNVFTQLRIKQFTLLLKLENVTQGLTDPMFLAAPNYPLPDFRFRFGATWNFFN